jgi:hypothetical protein
MQLRGSLASREAFCSRSGDDDDISSGQRNAMSVPTEPFTQDPLDAIPEHGTPEPFLHNQSQAMVRQAIDGEIDTEMAGPETSAGLFHLLEFVR